MRQSLNNKTPDEVYASASGGGALIVGKYPSEQGKVKTGAAPPSCKSNSVQLKRSKELS